MRHRRNCKTLGRSPSHLKAMLKNLVSSLVLHESIVTTKPKAKEARVLAEKLVTLGRRGDLHSRRLALSLLGNKSAVHKIFSEIALRNPDRKGGNVRILGLDRTRLGDNASQAIFEWVDKPIAVPKEDNSNPQVS
ncbi:MAG: 50S ribosomal protein L17 [Planctomycetes bacterium]|nr:50S ribosomal protein L17 [Planctomycetota bacterium]